MVDEGDRVLSVAGVAADSIIGSSIVIAKLSSTISSSIAIANNNFFKTRNRDC